MDMIMILKVCLFLVLFLIAYMTDTYLKQNKVFSIAADAMWEKAIEQENERKNQQQRLLLEEGQQEKVKFLYKLDLLVLQSNLNKYIPLLNTEILLVLTIGLAGGGFAITTSLTGTWVFGVLGFIGVCFGVYVVLHFMALANYRKTEDSLMTFINLLENYSSMEDELIAIFRRIQPFLTDPVQSAIEQCCREAELTGDRSRAIRNLEKSVQHEKFKELIRNLEICSRYEANYAEVVKDSRSLLREHLATVKEKKAIMNNARVEIAMIIGCSALVFYMMDDFTQQGIFAVLLSSLPGNVILLFCILILAYAIWTVLFSKH